MAFSDFLPFFFIVFPTIATQQFKHVNSAPKKNQWPFGSYPPFCSSSNDLRSTGCVTVGAGTYGRNKNGFFFPFQEHRHADEEPGQSRHGEKDTKIARWTPWFFHLRWVQASQKTKEDSSGSNLAEGEELFFLQVDGLILGLVPRRRHLDWQAGRGP